MENKPVFPNGIMWKDVSDKAPLWIKGQIIISPQKLNAWLSENPSVLSPKGWLTLDIKQPKDESKSYYLAVNMFKPKEVTQEQLTEALNKQSELQEPNFDDIASSVPF